MQTVNYSINSLLGKSRGFTGGSEPDAVANAFMKRLLEDSVDVQVLNLTSIDAVNAHFLSAGKYDLIMKQVFFVNHFRWNLNQFDVFSSPKRPQHVQVSHVGWSTRRFE